MGIIEILNQYGFATLAAVGMGWFIYFIYTYITTQVKVKLNEMNIVLIGLIDRIRMLDNDLIRLRSKLNKVLTMRELEKQKKYMQDQLRKAGAKIKEISSKAPRWDDTE